MKTCKARVQATNEYVFDMHVKTWLEANDPIYCYNFLSLQVDGTDIPSMK